MENNDIEKLIEKWTQYALDEGRGSDVRSAIKYAIEEYSSMCENTFSKENKKTTTHIDRDGNLSVNGTFNFEGSLMELKKIIDNTLEEYGENTECKLDVFPHKKSSHLIITKK